jgi:hypothetical protein
LATVDNKKSSNEEDQQRPSSLSKDLTYASKLEGLFHSHQNLVEISWCSMDDAHYTMQFNFPLAKRRWML